MDNKPKNSYSVAVKGSLLDRKSSANYSNIENFESVLCTRKIKSKDYWMTERAGSTQEKLSMVSFITAKQGVS